MDNTKRFFLKLLLIPLGLIAIFALIAIFGLRTWEDMLFPIVGILIGEVFALLLFLYFFKIKKYKDDDLDQFTEDDKKDTYL